LLWVCCVHAISLPNVARVRLGVLCGCSPLVTSARGSSAPIVVCVLWTLSLPCAVCRPKKQTQKKVFATSPPAPVRSLPKTTKKTSKTVTPISPELPEPHSLPRAALAAAIGRIHRSGGEGWTYSSGSGGASGKTRRFGSEREKNVDTGFERRKNPYITYGSASTCEPLS